jgi:hypothetical protein
VLCKLEKTCVRYTSSRACITKGYSSPKDVRYDLKRSETTRQIAELVMSDSERIGLQNRGAASGIMGGSLNLIEIRQGDG